MEPKENTQPEKNQVRDEDRQLRSLHEICKHMHDVASGGKQWGQWPVLLARAAISQKHVFEGLCLFVELLKSDLCGASVWPFY